MERTAALYYFPTDATWKRVPLTQCRVRIEDPQGFMVGRRSEAISGLRSQYRAQASSRFTLHLEAMLESTGQRDVAGFVFNHYLAGKTFAFSADIRRTVGGYSTGLQLSGATAVHLDALPWSGWESGATFPDNDSVAWLRSPGPEYLSEVRGVEGIDRLTVHLTEGLTHEYRSGLLLTHHWFFPYLRAPTGVLEGVLDGVASHFESLGNHHFRWDAQLPVEEDQATLFRALFYESDLQRRYGTEGQIDSGAYGTFNPGHRFS